MTIYEIDREADRLLAGSVDEETGEILFDEELFKKLDELQMAREAKIENCAMAYKNYMSELEGLKAQKEFLVKPLDKRIKHLQARARSAQEYLEYALKGETFRSDRVDISYSKAESTETDEEFIEWAKKHKKKYPDFLTFAEPKVNKTAVKKAIKNGEKILHAWLSSGKMKIG